MYLTKASTIKIGRSKYMVNLREDGMVLDDGLVLRLASDRFLATTSSGHGNHMLSHFEHYRATEWSGRAVTLTDVTEAWAVIAVAGPRSRGHARESARGGLAEPPELASGTWILPTGITRAATFGCCARASPASSPLNCTAGRAAPCRCGRRWSRAACRPTASTRSTSCASRRATSSSSEFNGETTPHDLGMEALVRLGNPCVGRELLDRPGFHEPARPRLVGVRASDGRAKFLAGAQLTTPDEPVRPAGYVTSTVYSPALGEWIGLALVSRRLGEEAALTARDPLRGGDTRMRIVSPVHFDPNGVRMKT